MDEEQEVKIDEEQLDDELRVRGEVPLKVQVQGSDKTAINFKQIPEIRLQR